MENMVIEISIEIIIAIMAPLITVGAFVSRYFWKKEQCFTLMKKTLDDLSQKEDTSHDTHGTLYDKINDLGNRTTALESKIDLLLDYYSKKYL